MLGLFFYVCYYTANWKDFYMSKIEEKVAFEEAMERLEGIVLRLEKGDLPLDESIEAFEQGASYVKLCQEKLAQAEMRIEKIIKEKEKE